MFKLLTSGQPIPSLGENEIYLRVDNWNDYSFRTLFGVVVFDEHGRRHDLGQVKIGFFGQTPIVSTYASLPQSFSELPNGYFSLGMNVEYYRILSNDLSKEFSRGYFQAIRDVVANPENLQNAHGQDVFRASLLRFVSMSTIQGQFRRVFEGGVPLTDFEFTFSRLENASLCGIKLEFKVAANSQPRTNIHAIIGRNGVGKTTLLNGMIEAITKGQHSGGKFLSMGFLGEEEVGANYFSRLVSVSFSAFDPFTPPPEQSDPELGTCYYYVGLKDSQDDSGTLLKSLLDLRTECVSALSECVSDARKRKRWSEAISTLESDENFSEMSLVDLVEFSGEVLREKSLSLLKRMSAGHAIVLLTITKLVATVEERTLVIMDEPESHLHPPLLSAFTRALSELLSDRNGVAILATHSPVVLQETPRTCVWKLTRSGFVVSATRPDAETFGENVGILTREVFGLEVVKSGFHTSLSKAVESGETYEAILDTFDDQLGFEAKAILRSMVFERDSKADSQ